MCVCICACTCTMYKHLCAFFFLRECVSARYFHFTNNKIYIDIYILLLNLFLRCHISNCFLNQQSRVFFYILVKIVFRYFFIERLIIFIFGYVCVFVCKMCNSVFVLFVFPYFHNSAENSYVQCTYSVLF